MRTIEDRTPSSKPVVHSSLILPFPRAAVWRALAPALAAVLLCTSLAVAATSEPGLEGWGRGQAYDHLYDPGREVYMPSRVLQVERFVPQPGMAEGVRAFVDAGRESLWVHLGPAAYVDAQAFPLTSGDAVVVTGALTTLDAHHAVLASRVEKSGHTLKLRDASGQPAWSNFHPRAAR